MAYATVRSPAAGGYLLSGLGRALGDESAPIKLFAGDLLDDAGRVLLPSAAGFRVVLVQAAAARTTTFVPSGVGLDNEAKSTHYFL